MAADAVSSSVPELETVLVEVDEHGVAVITMNRPKRRNAFNNQLYTDMTAALAFCSSAAAVGAVIITGSGRFFSSGADLQASADMGGDKFDSLNAPVGRFMLALHSFPKPVAACVNGPAVGIGTTLVPHCDFAFAAPSAYFWTPFSRIAVVPEFASTILFPEIMGTSLANEMLLLGRRMDVETAVKCGFVSAVVPAEALLEKVRAKLHTMLAYTHGFKSAALFKRMVKERREADITAVIKMELIELDKRLESGETAEAAMATIMAMAKAKQEAKNRKPKVSTLPKASRL